MAMNKQQAMEGLKAGRTLIQEEWSDMDEIKMVDELIAEGWAWSSTGWEYKDGYQCERRRVIATDKLKLFVPAA